MTLPCRPADWQLEMLCNIVTTERSALIANASRIIRKVSKYKQTLETAV